MERIRPATYMQRATILLLPFVMALTCSREANETPPLNLIPGDVAFVLLADNRLIAIDILSGLHVQMLQLAAPPPEHRVSAGQRMKTSPDGLSLFVLVAGEPDQLAVIDTQTGLLRSSLTLPASVSFASLDASRDAAHIYLFGNKGSDELVVLIIDGETNLGMDMWEYEFGDGRDWRVYQGTVSRDESHIFISYHGEDTTGIDTFLLEDFLVRCSDRGAPNWGCLAGHGSFGFRNDRAMIVATGLPEVLEYALDDESGWILLATHDTKLEGNHLMEFALDVAGDQLLAVGSCGYSGGLSRVNFGTGLVELLAPVGQTQVCGERITRGRGGLILVARLPRPVPTLQVVPGREPALLAFDSVGTLLQAVQLPADPVDVLVR